MNQDEITKALTEVRRCGGEFTKAFNALSELVEMLAMENEDLKAENTKLDAELAKATEVKGKLELDLAEANHRAKTAEAETQRLAREVHGSDDLVAGLKSEITSLKAENSRLLSVILAVATTVDSAKVRPDSPSLDATYLQVPPEPHAHRAHLVA